MTKVYKILVLMFFAAACSVSLAGEIVPGFDDADALVDFSEKTAQSQTCPPIDSSGLITLSAKFTPTEADTTKTDGPVIVIEVGGTTFGTGLYICDGMLTFCSKGAGGSGGEQANVASLDDTDASGDEGVAVAMGPVYPGVETEAFASFNANTGELAVMINGRLYEETITGTLGSTNLTGDRRVSVLGQFPAEGESYNYPSMGGLSRDWYPSIELVTSDGCAVAMETEGGSDVRGQIFEDVIDLETFPRNPVPANNAINVDPAAVTSVQFDTAGDPADTSNPNPDITGHFVTIYSTFDPADPNNNVAEVDTFVPAGSDPVQVPYSFNLGDEVFWQVEEQVSGASKGAPGNIAGPVWEFEALPAIPAITASPEDTADFAGTEVTLNASFTSKSAASVNWVKAGEPELILDDSDPDVTIGVSQHGDSYTTSLSIADFEKADEGEYFCRTNNAAGTVDTDSAMLGVKRMIGYWPLDGDYTDASGEGHHADPNTTPLASQWVDGVDPAMTGQALDTEPNALVAAETDAFVPAEYTNGLSVTLWIKWAGSGVAPTDWTGLVCSKDQQLDNNWWFGLGPDGQIDINHQDYGPVTAPQEYYLPEGEWAHIAFVNNEDEQGKLYVNGTLAAVGGPFKTSRNELPVQLMSDMRDENGTLWRPTYGVFDEIKMYNYALSSDEVAEQYYQITGETVCTEPESPVLQFDFNGDCKVDLADFALMAGDWNESNLYPQLD
ncbi:LamG-like jellyroll fold domain-containing protein [Sedimentisphaera salicampi]|uniref:LamG-like jellyroll fold domain-containing protein n=1 Tax=Sedimentisphaera salicampi TaxID=1941349 RepID=UPI000B9CF30D|nr:LamG-like jellyroll fold domain-containing protein [Sedimentisphaera salicampi]OXU15792.1 Immunoglobulin I-set domain protein [Sedimentisphaera salicampi]